MRRGLDSPVSFVMRKDPDLTREQANAFIVKNLADFAVLVMASRELNVPKGADAENPGKTPEENGADNQKRDEQQPSLAS
jgi:hypothetical protein